MPPNKTTRPEAPEYKSAEYLPELKSQQNQIGYTLVAMCICFRIKIYSLSRRRLTFGVKVIKPLLFEFSSIHSVLKCMRLRMLSRSPLCSSLNPGSSSLHPSLCPETVGLFHTPALLTTSYRSQQSRNAWKSRVFERRRSHRPKRTSHTCGFSKSTLSSVIRAIYHIYHIIITSYCNSKLQFNSHP